MKLAALLFATLLMAQTPVPMHMGGMDAAQCQQMMQQHQGMAKSQADRDYMAAMMQMHHGMMAHPMTGDADHDFMVMMIPHHQAAIAMAQTELKYGKNPKLQAMAKAIISAQQAEIDQMNGMLP